ncbi:GAF domain-containing sensor histidine kinase [Gracilimonas sp. Q87]|uniref:GAF domain-containing sensor histidine kinase n=1 Tax=Gracilimonas sp. Q87 TaxID=3384766 RepID=UPI003983FD27
METNVLNPIPEKEFERLMELSELDLDYSDLDDQFKDLTKLAAKIAGTAISLINLIDTFTQWSIAHYGLPIDQMPREKSVCQYTIVGDDPLEVEDLSADERFNKFDYVTEDPNLRYYYGIPLTTKDGNNIGALCVLDDDQKNLTPEKIEMLKIIATEIVGRLSAYKALNTLKDELEEAKESQRKLSHDIRGPLGGIIGVADLIKEQGEKKDVDDILELINLIKQGGQSLLELADDVLSSSNTEEMRSPKSNEFNLYTLKDKLEQLYIPQAKAKYIDLTIVNESENAEIPFPKNKILQILGNIISNAIKFTPDGGMVMVRQEFNLNKESDTAKLLFSIKDTGVGISSGKIEEILNENAQSTSGTKGESGYGFGLPLVKHLIDKLDGNLHINSIEGEGTLFKVTLPIK